MKKFEVFSAKNLDFTVVVHRKESYPTIYISDGTNEMHYRPTRKPQWQFAILGSKRRKHYLAKKFRSLMASVSLWIDNDLGLSLEEYLELICA